MCIRDSFGLLVETGVDAGKGSIGQEDVVRGGAAEIQRRAVDDEAADRLAGRVDREHQHSSESVSYTHLRAHETVLDLVCRLLLDKKQTTSQTQDAHLTVT